ncbi:WXG100 family type VII secretion target [Nocardioides alkalitolerans]|uniref:WXG100 family type VII secretion target n=1 Tax=Nocardioides alkalitolerans TaxID=281714 RepID=UPI000421FBFD|nr:WXG100 family type VII secretion target [Nocardioides alkalitolerans]
MSENMKMGEGTLISAGQMVIEAKADFNQKSNALASQIQGMANRWQGQGGAAFQTLIVQWGEKQRTITNALENFERSLTDTDRDTTSTDSGQSDTFTSHLSRLDG